MVEDAGHWWNSNCQGITEEEQQEMSWEMFKRIVTEKYFPRSHRNQMQTEFLNLKQGTSTVTEYERKFNRLSRYAAKLVSEEEDKADRFIRGLRNDIQGILVGQEILDYGLAVRRAHEIEAALGVKSSENLGKRKWEEKNRVNGKFNAKKGKSEAQTVHATTSEKPTCLECQRQHYEECWGQNGSCFKCHEKGHFAKDCSKREKNDQKPTGKARLYAFTQKEAGEEDGNMAGMVNVFGLPVLALFDSEASHSFISAELCAKLELGVGLENLALDVKIPSGETLRTDRMARNVNLDLGGLKLVANLYTLEMRDFVLILGMDWLSDNHTTIRCRERKVIFQQPGKEEFTFHGAKTGRLPRVISAMKLLRKDGCQGYLVNIMGSTP